jgi:hypothetical protein
MRAEARKVIGVVDAVLQEHDCAVNKGHRVLLPRELED